MRGSAGPRGPLAVTCAEHVSAQVCAAPGAACFPRLLQVSPLSQHGVRAHCAEAVTRPPGARSARWGWFRANRISGICVLCGEREAGSHGVGDTLLCAVLCTEAVQTINLRPPAHPGKVRHASRPETTAVLFAGVIVGAGGGAAGGRAGQGCRAAGCPAVVFICLRAPVRAGPRGLALKVNSVTAGGEEARRCGFRLCCQRGEAPPVRLKRPGTRSGRGRGSGG